MTIDSGFVAEQLQSFLLTTGGRPRPASHQRVAERDTEDRSAECVDLRCEG